MTYSSPFVYFRINGGFGSSSTPTEKWSVGLKLRQSGSGSPDATQLTAFLAAAEPVVRTFHTASKTQAGSFTYVTELTAALVGTDGFYVGGVLQQTTRRPIVTQLPGVGTGTHPWYVATVYTLKTVLPRGAGSNGRFYWPAIAKTYQPGAGDISATDAATNATEGATFIAGINTAATTTITGNNGVYVMSRVGSGAAAPAIAVRVGRRPDTQRRRSNDVLEQYATAPITGALSSLDARDRTPFGELDAWNAQR